MSKFTLKVSAPVFYFIETVVNAVNVFIKAVTPNTPTYIAAEALLIVIDNAVVVLVGVESGDIPEP